MACLKKLIAPLPRHGKAVYCHKLLKASSSFTHIAAVDRHWPLPALKTKTAAPLRDSPWSPNMASGRVLAHTKNYPITWLQATPNKFHVIKEFSTIWQDKPLLCGGAASDVP
jgi:hypothetical protein